MNPESGCLPPSPAPVGTGAPACLSQPQGGEGAFIRHRCIPNCFTLVAGPCEEAHLGPEARLGSVHARDATIAAATTALVSHHQHHRQLSLSPSPSCPPDPWLQTSLPARARTLTPPSREGPDAEGLGQVPRMDTELAS